MIARLVDPRVYWAVKGLGRIILLTGIFVYGVGLLLKRAAAERTEAYDDDHTRFTL